MEKFKKTHVVASYECDERTELRLRSLFNLFQGMADEHAADMGVGYAFCKAHRLAWVGAAYHLKINRLPVWGETLFLSTWPSGKTPVSGIRDFEIKDTAGHLLCAASSQWVLISAETRRPVPVKNHIASYELLDEHVFEQAFVKTALPESFSFEKTFPVHRDEIDLNDHVNNAVYPAWSEDALPPDFWKKNKLKEMIVFFKSPAKADDVVRLSSAFEENTVIHVLREAREGRVFAQIKMIFAPRSEEKA